MTDRLIEELRRTVPGGGKRGSLSVWFGQNFAEFSQLAAEKFVEAGLLEARPEFHEAGPAGEAERQRLAGIAKRTWNRVRVGMRAAGVSAPASAPRPMPEPRPMPAVRPAVTPLGDSDAPTTEDMLRRLGNTLDKRSK